MELLRLVFQNIKKRKGYSIIIFSLILIASLLLISSISIYRYSNHIMDAEATKLHTPDSIYRFLSNDYQDDYEQFFKNHASVSDVEKTQSLYFSDSTLKDQKNSDYDIGYLFINSYQSNQKIDQLKSVGPKVDDLNKGEIILPYLFHQTKGLNVGDTVILNLNNHNYSFKVKGFVEDLMLGSSITIAKQIWISQNDYENLLMPQATAENQVTSLKIIYQTTQVGNKIENQFDETYHPHTIFTINFSLAKNTTMSILNLILAIMLFFSIFLILITVMVIRYSILVSIEADYTEIGILKALGFSYRQIHFITLLPYTMISIVSTLLSLGVSAFVIYFMGNILFNSSGLVWSGSLSFILSISIVIIVTLLITLYAYWIARKTKKISPVIAIRQGVAPVHFSSRLHLNLAKIKRLPIIFMLSLKQMTTKFKQYLMLFVISIILIFPLIFGGALSHLFHNPTNAMEIIGLEPTDISFSVNKDEDFNSVIQDIQTNEGNNINHILPIDEDELQIDHQKIETFISQDFNKLMTSNVVEGRNPIYKNEIAFTPSMLHELHKKMGDFVTIKNSQNQNEKFLIVGSYQSVENGGSTARINVSGMKVIEPNFHLTGVYVYLNKNVNVDTVIKGLNHKYGDHISLIVNQQKSMESIFVPINHSINMIINVLFVVSSVIVLLVTYLITNIIVFKEKKEMGIMKAMGFTSMQIRRQIIYRLLMVTFLGVIFGIIIALIVSGPLFILLLNQFGIAKLTLHYDYLTIGIQAILLLIVTYLSSWFVTKFVKKIKPNQLINE